MQTSRNVTRKIAFRRSPLAAFSEELGHWSYGDRWRPGLMVSRRGASSNISEENRAIHLDLLNQLTLALNAGLIEAQFEGNIPSDPAIESTSDSDSDQNRRRSSPEHYIVSSAFWNERWLDCVLNWNTSVLRVDIDCIMLSRHSPHGAEQGGAEPITTTKPYLAQIKPPSLLGKIYIKQVELAYGVASLELPRYESISADRYRGLNIRFRDELIAVAWRKVAMYLVKSRRKKVTPEYLYGAMAEFMSLENITEDEKNFSKANLMAISTKMVSQFAKREDVSRPFVNSTLTPKAEKRSSRAK